MSGAWHLIFRISYCVLSLIDPLLRATWQRQGLGNVVDLRVIGRRSGLERSTLLGLLRVGDRMYLGHPDGEVPWTRNLVAAGAGRLVMHGGGSLDFAAVRLAAGQERDAAIGATGQHPFPGNLLYRLGRAHVRRKGVFFRIEPLGDDPTLPTEGG